MSVQDLGASSGLFDMKHIFVSIFMVTQHQQTYAKNRQTKKAYTFCVKVNIIDRLFFVQAV